MQTKQSDRSIFLLTAGCFLAFFLFGFTDNLKGPTLPAMLAELNIDYGVGGNIFFGEYLGFLISTLITGILADRFGLKIVMMLAGVLLLFGVGGYSSLQTPVLLGASLFIIGLGLGAFELGPNSLIVSLHHERKGLFLNLMAVMHGLGSMVAPLFAGWLFGLNHTWRAIYRWDIALILFFILFTVLLRFPKTDDTSQLDFRQIPRVAFKGQLPWFYLAIMFYVSAEIGIASWLVTFLQDARGASVLASNQALSLFFGMLMAGRLLGGFFVQRVGYLRSILFASIGAIACIGIGLFTPLAWLLSITGLFLSFIFPTITAAVSDAYTENINTTLGVLFTFAGIGGLLGPWLIGWASDVLGLETGFAVNLILAGLLTSSVIVLIKGRNDGTKT